MNIAPKSKTMPRTIAAAFALLGWFTLYLQLSLVINSSSPNLSPGEAIARYFSYFTIQSNIFVAMVLTVFAVKRRMDDWLVHPFVRSAVATYIAVVGLVYVVVLRQLWAPQGAQWFADVVLHYIMPVAYLSFWFLVVPKHGLRWYDPLLWLIYPMFYLTFVLIRGAISAFYPYEFIDAGKLGKTSLTINAAGMMVLFIVVGAAVIVIGRLQARHRKA